MLYARICIMDKYDLYQGSVKVVAESRQAYEEYKTHLEETNVILDEFVDDYFGTVCVLPEDFDY